MKFYNRATELAELQRIKENLKPQLLEMKIVVLKTKVLNKYAIDWLCLNITDM